MGPAPSTGYPTPPPERPTGLHVLVVEDDRDSAWSLAVLLRLDGHDVAVSGDGPAALRAARDRSPDVVLLDIGLPGMDGYELARQLAGQPAEKRPLLVAVTGWGAAADRQHSAEAGIDLHLVKPVDPQELRGLLRRFRQIIA
jgi:CheY-like chemotaxis protein